MRRWGVAALALVLSTALGSGAIAGTELALTVDDLPTHGALPAGATRRAIADQMIQALKRHAAPGVYGFTNGGQLPGDPALEEILRAWRHAGFVLGNHTYSHLDLTRARAADYVVDIERNEELLARLSPAGASKYFRYPYLHEGDTREKRKAIREWLTARGYTIAQVTVSLEDEWAWNDVYARCVAINDQDAIARMKRLFLESATSRLAAFEELSRRLFGRSIRHILMVHMGAFDALMLDDLLTAYRAAGTRFISLQEATQDPAYRLVPRLVQAGGATFLVQVARDRRVPLPDALTRPREEVARLCR